MSAMVEELSVEQWLLKVAALIHDPPDKVALISGHGRRAANSLPSYLAKWMQERGVDVEELVRRHHANEDEVPVEIKGQLKRLKRADWLSSASERIALDLASKALDLSPDKINVDYIELVHPFSGLETCLGKREVRKLWEQLGATRHEGKLLLVSNVLSVLAKTCRLPAHNVLRRLGGSGAKLLYLLLWRLLEVKWRELVRGLSDPRVASLPADSRVPTHSIWDHVETTSAIIPCLENEGLKPALKASLLSMDLGGVQPFISAARKTSDLWAGSWISSIISWSAIREVCRLLGPDAIIYPYLKGLPFVDLWLANELAQLLRDGEILSESDVEEFSGKLIEELWKLEWGSPEQGKRLLYLSLVPNSALALVPSHLCETLEERMRSALEDCWKRICEIARKRIRNLMSEEILKSSIEEGWEERWRRQVERPPLWPIRIAHTPFPERDEDVEEFLNRSYEDLPRELANSLLKLVKELKRVRSTVVYGAIYALNMLKLSAHIPSFDINVEPSPREEGGALAERCTLCGMRNPLFLKKEIWRALKNARPGLIEWDERFDSGEYLCAPCLIKRLLGSDDRFFREVLRAVIGLPEGLSKGLTTEELEVRFPSTSDFATATFKISLCEAISWALEKGGKEETFGELLKLLNTAKRLEKKLSELKWRIGLLPSYQPPAIEDRLSQLCQIRARIKGSTGSQCESSEVLEGLKSLEKLLRRPGEVLMKETWLRLKERFKEICGELEDVHKELGEFLKLAEDLIKGWFNALGRRSEELPFRIGECMDDLTEVPHPLMPCAWRKNPGSFFALLKSDGDDIGRWISGEFLPSYFDSLHPQIQKQIRNKNKAQGLLQEMRAMSPASHMAFSRALMNFGARVVPKVVEEIGLGSVVYSGGDDLTALLAPELAPEVAQRLAEEFSREFDAVPGLIFYGLGYRVSCSAGLIIAHYMYHLGRGVEMVAEAIEKAKHIDGKGAIYAELLARAGTIIRLERGVHWAYPWDEKKRADHVKLHQYGIAWWKGLSLSRNPSDPLTVTIGTGEHQSPLKSPVIEAQAIAAIVNRLIQLTRKNIRVARGLIYVLNAPELQRALAIGGPIASALIKREVGRHVSGSPSATLERVKKVVSSFLSSWYQVSALKEVISDFMRLIHIVDRCLSGSLLRAKPRWEE